MHRHCFAQGLTSAAGAGALGYFFGFVPALLRHKGRAWGLVNAEGMRSARQLALMSGLYTTIHCICGRIRLKEDGWNRAVAGCSTGLVLGWAGGPVSALQSCAGIGALSYFLDFGEVAGGATAVAPAHAATLHEPAAAQQRRTGSASSSDSGSPAEGWEQSAGEAFERGVRHMRQQLLGPLVASPLGAVALPPLMWLGTCCNAGCGVGVGTLTAGASGPGSHRA